MRLDGEIIRAIIGFAFNYIFTFIFDTEGILKNVIMPLDIQGGPLLLLDIILDDKGILENVIMPLDIQGVPVLLDWSGESFAIVGDGATGSFVRRICHL